MLIFCQTFDVYKSDAYKLRRILYVDQNPL